MIRVISALRRILAGVPNFSEALFTRCPQLSMKSTLMFQVYFETRKIEGVGNVWRISVLIGLPRRDGNGAERAGATARFAA